MNRLVQMALISFIVTYSFYVLSYFNMADLDLWGYLAFGRLFWTSGRFPYGDAFAYVPTLNPWVYHEWLTGVLFYPIYQSLGASGLQIMKYGLGLMTLVLVFLTAIRRGAHPVCAGILLAVVAGGIKVSYSPVRAQVFTIFFFALSLYILERARLSGCRGILWLLPLIHIPWCNLHGGFLAGLGLMGIYFLGELLARRSFIPYLGVLVLSTLFTLINPYGIEYWEYMVRAISMPRPYIMEWASLFELYRTGEEVLFQIQVVVFVCLGLFAMWQSRKWELTPSLALLVTFILGVRHNRHLTFFFILWGAYLPLYFNKQVDYIKSNQVFARLWSRKAVKLGISSILLILSITLGFQSFQRQPLSLQIPEKPSPRIPFPYPVGAVKYIKEQAISGKILSTFGWGEYLIWELYPQCRVGFDGRYETVYPPEVEEDFTKFINARTGWREFLVKYPPDMILVNPRAEIAGLIRKEPEWEKGYEDQGSVLFIRRPASGR